jgi:hypothetical protein
MLALCILPFTLGKLYNNTVYVLKYLCLLKLATHCGRNMYQCCNIQALVQYLVVNLLMDVSILNVMELYFH